jgi:uncharacterized protein YacL
LTFTILRVDGSVETIEHRGASEDDAMNLVKTLIDARQGVDFVNLRDGTLLVVDDVGHIVGKPVNEQATRRYLAVCVPGTTYVIRGDAAIVPK